MASSPAESGYQRHRWLFALCFALLVSHELDAMVREEWNLLPGFKSVDDDNAADVFNLAHVPIFAGLLWLLSSARPAWRGRTMVGIEVFVIGHAIAHTLLRGHPDYRFEAPVETVTVYGAALAGLAHLATARGIGTALHQPPTASWDG